MPVSTSLHPMAGIACMMLGVGQALSPDVWLSMQLLVFRPTHDFVFVNVNVLLASLGQLCCSQYQADAT